MTDLERTNAELRTARIFAGKRIVDSISADVMAGEADPAASVAGITEDRLYTAGGVAAGSSLRYALPCLALPAFMISWFSFFSRLNSWTH